MTDISELVQRIKTAAEKVSGGDWVKEYGDGWDAICSNDDQANGGFIIANFEGPDAAVNRNFVQSANPANILALTNAIEKMTQANRSQSDHIGQQQDRIESLEKGSKQAAKHIHSWRELAKQNIEEREKDISELIAARARIAELEARTVKLPKPHAHLIWIQAGHAPDDFWDDVTVSHSEKDRSCDGSERYPVYARWEIEEVLKAAGIKWESE